MKAAIVGAGLMGSIHAGSLSKMPEASIKWIVDRDKTRGGRLAKAIGARWSPSIDAVIKDAETELVIHAIPTPFRLPFIKKYMAAGKHIFCEKPLASNLKEAQAIRDAARNYKPVFMAGHVVRFFWEYAHARETILSGGIGKAGIVRLSRCCGKPASFDKKDNWYLDYKRSGGVFLDLAIHDLDWLLWTFGSAARVFGQNLGSKGIAEDYGLGIIKFKNGVLAHVEASWAEPDGSFWTGFEASGTEGMLEFDMRDAATLTLAKKKKTAGSAAGTIVPESPSSESPYQKEMRHFIQCVQGGAKPLAGAADAFNAARLAFALMESARTNKAIEL